MLALDRAEWSGTAVWYSE